MIRLGQAGAFSEGKGGQLGQLMWMMRVCTGLRLGSRLQAVAIDQKGDSWDWDCACQGIIPVCAAAVGRGWSGVEVEIRGPGEQLSAPWLNDWV